MKPTYPKNWKEVSRDVRHGRANGRCECTGECGLHQTTGGPRRCEEIDGARAKWAKGKVVLTTAHLCKCDPLCANLRHLKAMCNRCHLRVDVKLHQRHRSENREKRAGQSRLFAR